MPLRTSHTHPLRIDAVTAATGRIGMTFCPGKRQQHAATGAWNRDLDLDLAAIHQWGATAVVTLMETPELEALAVDSRQLAQGLADRGIAWLQLAIADGGTPEESFEHQWAAAGPWLRSLLRRGKSVVLHCKGGLGRTGMVAARLLVELGEDPGAAILAVRAARPRTIENRSQEEHVRRMRPVETPEHPERIRGCLLAGAMGDALGAGIEFLDLAAIRRRYGPAGATGYTPAYGQAAPITDDTQMTLFTVEGLVRAQVRWRGKGICHPPSVVHNAYLRWLLTQGMDDRAVREIVAREPTGEPDGWLFADPRLHSRRAPGNTCLSALSGGGDRRSDGALNDSKGCGGAMRVAPAGLLGSRAPEAFALGSQLAALTHGHPSGHLAAGCMAAIVAELAAGSELRGSVELARRELRHSRGHEETEAALALALALADASDPSPEAVERLGGGWVAEEALAIAVYCALAGERAASGGQPLTGALRAALLLAVNHSGDSDSTGSMTGQILGTRWGDAALPADLLEVLELRDVVETLADDLARELAAVTAPDDAWWRRYPGW